jgi:hypothetical protein
MKMKIIILISSEECTTAAEKRKRGDGDVLVCKGMCSAAPLDRRQWGKFVAVAVANVADHASIRVQIVVRKSFFCYLSSFSLDSLSATLTLHAYAYRSCIILP